MDCPNCGNSDQDLIEELRAVDGWRVFLCGVCSKVWREVQREKERVEG